MTEKRDLPSKFEQQWREWSAADPVIDEVQLKRNLRQRIPDRRPRPLIRWVAAAAAASLLVGIIGVESIYRSRPTSEIDEVAVHEINEGVILILREGKEPIYVLTGSAPNGEGVNR